MHILSTEAQHLSQFEAAILHKCVKEEIMTESELDIKLDNIMSKYVAPIDRKFENMERSVYNMITLAA